MNNPNKEAKELIWEYYDMGMSMKQAKQCALKAVQLIIEKGNLEPQLKRHIGNVPPLVIHLEYWFEVKEKIIKYE